MSRLVAFQTDPKTFEQNTAQCNVTVLQSNALVTSHQGAANSKQINLNSTHFKSSSSLYLTSYPGHELDSKDHDQILRLRNA